MKETSQTTQRHIPVRVTSKIAGCCVMGFYFLLNALPVWSQGRHHMAPRVPPDHLQEARSLHSPILSSPETIEAGKILYEGKGTCVNCHGEFGNGAGPGAANLTPSPRNFQHHGFWRHRTEGEIFWVIKHGSPRTAMIPFGGLLSDEEIWTIIQYEQTFSHRSGRHGPRRGRGPMPHREEMEHHQGGRGSCCGDR